MPASALSDDDARLLRLLYDSGKLSPVRISSALDQVRAERSTNPQASLATHLVSSGLLSQAELEAIWLSEEVTERTLAVERRPSPSDMQPLSGWTPGAQIAGYTLHEALGKGGMGVVLRATHVATGREVALKGLRYADPDALERFTREAQAQASVDDHPNVVRIFEAGQFEGECYLAMERVSGGDLGQRLKRGEPLSAAEVASTVGQLARGLAHVHARGILHRDLKPRNILFDDHGVPKLVDFGLARLEGADSLTQSGQLLGTPAYMAPEQALGLNDQVDERTDVYGLGAVLFACLTGVPPFRGQVAEVLAQVAKSSPPRPSSLRGDVDPRLEAICLRALAKRPEDRFATAADFAAALEGWSVSDATPARGRSVVLGVAGLALGLALGFAAGLSVGRSAAPSEAGESSPALVQDRVPNEELEPGQAVLLPAEGSGGSRWRLGWVVKVVSEARMPRVHVMNAEGDVDTAVAPPSGFSREAFGVGARVLLADGRVGTVIQRRGPVAQVEPTDEEPCWVAVSRLLLEGDGVPAREDAGAEVVLAPWSGDAQLYTAVIVEGGPQDTEVGVAYLDGDAAQVSRADLRALPLVGGQVFYAQREPEAPQPAKVVGYVGGWLVRLENPDGRQHLVSLSRLVLAGQ